MRCIKHYSLFNFRERKFIKRENYNKKKENPKYNLWDGRSSAKDCALIKFFLFWNSSRKRWNHQLLVCFSAIALSVGNQSLVALLSLLSAFDNSTLLNFVQTSPIRCSPPYKITDGPSVQRRFSDSRRNWAEKGDCMYHGTLPSVC